MLEENRSGLASVFAPLTLAGLLTASVGGQAFASEQDITKTLAWNNPNSSSTPVCGTRIDAFLFYPDTDTTTPQERIAARSYNARTSSYRPYGGPLPTSDTMTVTVNNSKEWAILYIAYFLAPKPEFGTNPDEACYAAFQYVGTGTNPYITSTRNIENIQNATNGNTNFACTTSFLEQYSPPGSPDRDGDGIGDDAESVMGTSLGNPNSDSDGANDWREYCLAAINDASVQFKRTADGKALGKTRNFFDPSRRDSDIFEEVYSGQAPYPVGFNNM